MVMEHEKFAKSHGILPILPPDFTNFVDFLLTARNSTGRYFFKLNTLLDASVAVNDVLQMVFHSVLEMLTNLTTILPFGSR